MNLAMNGGDEATNKLNEMLDDLAMYEGKDIRGEKVKGAWDSLKAKGKG